MESTKSCRKGLPLKGRRRSGNATAKRLDSDSGLRPTGFCSRLWQDLSSHPPSVQIVTAPPIVINEATYIKLLAQPGTNAYSDIFARALLFREACTGDRGGAVRVVGGCVVPSTEGRTGHSWWSQWQRLGQVGGYSGASAWRPQPFPTLTLQPGQPCNSGALCPPSGRSPLPVYGWLLIGQELFKFRLLPLAS